MCTASAVPWCVHYIGVSLWAISILILFFTAICNVRPKLYTPGNLLGKFQKKGVVQTRHLLTLLHTTLNTLFPKTQQNTANSTETLNGLPPVPLPQGGPMRIHPLHILSDGIDGMAQNGHYIPDSLLYAKFQSTRTHKVD